MCTLRASCMAVFACRLLLRWGGVVDTRAAPLAAQAELSQLNADRERTRGSAAAAEARAEELGRELEVARQVRGRVGGRVVGVVAPRAARGGLSKAVAGACCDTPARRRPPQNLVSTLRGLEARHDAARAAADAKARAERAHASEEARALEAAAAAARARAGRLQQLFEALAAEAAALWQRAAAPAPAPGGGAPPLPLAVAEQLAPARWLYRLAPGGAWAAAEGALRELASEPNPGALGGRARRSAACCLLRVPQQCKHACRPA